MKKLAQGFNTAAQDSNPGPLNRESDALPLSHGAHVKKSINNIQNEMERHPGPDIHSRLASRGP